MATATAEHSTYAGIVRLVEEAQSSKAPFVRLADRYALLFVPLTLVIAGYAWVTSGDPVRALSVLVVATPCPLLLAAPIAIVAGISRSAKRGIIVKGGGALEAIARARVLLFDKTGTLTAGRPHLADVAAAPDRTPEEVLRYAGSLEQVSPHVLASSIVSGARERGVALVLPEEAEEVPGAGITGRVDGLLVHVGTADFATDGAPLPAWARDVRRRVNLEGATGVYVAVDGVLVGALVLDDPIRPETPRVIRSLRRAGVRRMVMVTGDHYGVADIVAAAIGVDAVLAERTPDRQGGRGRPGEGRRQRDPRDGRRRHQRRARARDRGRRRGDGSPGRDGQLRGGRHRDHGGPARPPPGGHPDRAPVPHDRAPERDRGHGPVAGRDAHRHDRRPAPRWPAP